MKTNRAQLKSSTISPLNIDRKHFTKIAVEKHTHQRQSIFHPFSRGRQIGVA
jgi:hypothetical protein